MVLLLSHFMYICKTDQWFICFIKIWRTFHSHTWTYMLAVKTLLDPAKLNSVVLYSQLFSTQNQFPWISLSVIYYLYFKLSLFQSTFCFPQVFLHVYAMLSHFWYFWCEESSLGLLSAIDLSFSTSYFILYQSPLFASGSNYNKPEC